MAQQAFFEPKFSIHGLTILSIRSPREPLIDRAAPGERTAMRKHVLMQHSLARLTGEMASYPAGAEGIITAEAAARAVQARESSGELAVELSHSAVHAFRPRAFFLHASTDMELVLYNTLS